MAQLKSNDEFSADITPAIPDEPTLLEGSIREKEALDAADEEAARRIAEKDLNQHKKQVHSGFALLWLAFQSTGVIYGDIGTSPLYVYSSTFTSQPSHEDLVGSLSIIIWSLTLIVTVKYCFIVLSADDDGQGGTFAMYSLLARYARIVKKDPQASSAGLLKLDRYATQDLPPANGKIRTMLERSRATKVVLKVIGVLGVSMVMADGVLTPAQSVLGAIQGIRVVRPDLGTDAIVGISCAILVALFLIQPFGTSKVGTAFAPVVIIWLLFNLCCGIYNLALHDASVLKAFSPHYSITYLVRNGRDGWESLGGLLLAFTGVEALFADIGAFGAKAVRISWLALAYPCLLLAYIGQAAYIAEDGDKGDGMAYTNPFFNTLIPGTFYFGLVIAILAAIVASQALITSSFQLLAQVMRMSYFPHIKMVHTSKQFHEQVYMPFANWLLMIGTVIVTAVYNNTTSLGHAYGVCVIIVTFITTCMVSLVAIIIWRFSLFVVLPIFLIFACLDGAFMSSALLKVPEGAWFTIVLAFILSSVFVLWRWGKEQQWAAEAEDRISSSDLFASTPSTVSLKSTATNTVPTATATATAAGGGGIVLPGSNVAETRSLSLTTAFGGGHVTTAPGVGIFFDKVGGPGDSIPKVFTHFIRKFKARPQVIIFLHMRPLSQPTISPEERFVITRASSFRNNTNIPSCYRITLRHGYSDDPLSPDLANVIMFELANYITRGGGSGKGQEEAASPSNLEPRIRQEMTTLQAAQDAQLVYIMGKQVMRVQTAGWKTFWRRIGLELFLFIRENSRAKMENLDIDNDNLVEVGFVKGI